jgi:hemerythrin-like domain-containing protein
MEAEKTKPIKRHEALLQFSREHHFGLLLGWKIKQGIRKNIDAERITDYTIFFFNEDLKNHFAEEEKTLFPKVSKDDALRVQAENQHTEIYALIEKLQTKNADYNLLSEFADKLEAHIRFEERTLFNHIQSKLSDEELAEVLHQHHHAACNIDDKWSDHFWENK